MLVKLDQLEAQMCLIGVNVFVSLRGCWLIRRMKAKRDLQEGHGFQYPTEVPSCFGLNYILSFLLFCLFFMFLLKCFSKMISQC